MIDWPVGDLEQLAAEAYTVSVELGQVWFELLYSWGHFDELEQATLQMMADEPTSPEE